MRRPWASSGFIEKTTPSPLEAFVLRLDVVNGERRMGDALLVDRLLICPRSGVIVRLQEQLTASGASDDTAVSHLSVPFERAGWGYQNSPAIVCSRRGVVSLW